MTLAETLKGLMWWRHDGPERCPADDELDALREQKAVADQRHANGVEALRTLNRDREDVIRLRANSRQQLETAHELRRELKSEPGL